MEHLGGGGSRNISYCNVGSSLCRGEGGVLIHRGSDRKYALVVYHVEDIVTPWLLLSWICTEIKEIIYLYFFHYIRHPQMIFRNVKSFLAYNI